MIGGRGCCKSRSGDVLLVEFELKGQDMVAVLGDAGLAVRLNLASRIGWGSQPERKKQRGAKRDKKPRDDHGGKARLV